MKIYGTTHDLHSIEDHVMAAYLFSYNNWERLSYTLNKNGVLDRFNTYFADVSVNPEKKRQLCIFIAGITACMHYQPTTIRRLVKEYLKNHEDLDKIYTELIEQSGSNQLRKYYRSSAEGFLIMKVYHLLITG